VTGIIFGLLPALRASRPDPWKTLKDTVGAVAGQGHHLEVVLGRQDHAQALDERVVVVGQDDPDRLPHCRSPRETPIRC
jgi:hypothetical protein